MKIIKKSDIKNYKKDKKEELDELVDANGDLTKGDKVFNSDSQITTGEEPITSDDHEDGTMQHRSMYGYYGAAYSNGLGRVAESRIKSIIEDILNKKSGDNDLVSDDNKLDSKINSFVKAIKSSDIKIDTEDIIKKLRDKFNG